MKTVVWKISNYSVDYVKIATQKCSQHSGQVMNKCAVKNVKLKEQPTHFIILSYAGNAGRSLGDNLI